MEQRFKVGLVGAGHIARFHVQALRALPNVDIIGVTDVCVSTAESLRTRLGLSATYESLAGLVAAGADVIHVLTPPDTHAALAVEALDRGCHVFVEKPLATDAGDCDRIAEAAARAGKSVCAGHSLLRDPFVARGIQLVRDGVIGDPVTVDYFRCQPCPPYHGGPLPAQFRDGGYPFRDLGVHALYLIEAFLGPIVTVDPTMRWSGRDSKLHFDEWRVLVECQGGTGQIQMSWNVRPQQNLLLVQGTRGAVRIDLCGMSVSVRRTRPLPEHANRVVNAVADGAQVASQALVNVARIATGRIRQFHGLQTLVAEFYAALARGHASPVTPEQAKPIVAWTERVARAADGLKRRDRAVYSAPLRAPVLVTGASGLIGSHLVQRLLGRGERIRAFVRRIPPAAWLDHPQVELVLGDLGDPEVVERAVRNVEIVYHLGAAMHGNTDAFESGTVAGTRNIVDAIVSNGSPARLVHMSSLAVLDAARSTGREPIAEDWPLEPRADERGVYTRTKLAAECYVLDAVQRRGLRAVILRPGEVVDDTRTLISSGVALRAGRRLIVLGKGRLALPMIYVEDLVDAILGAAASDCFDGSIFHLVDPHPVTQNELIEIERARSDTPLLTTHVPLPVTMAGAVGVQLLARLLRRSPPLSTYRVRSAVSVRRFDCSKARRHLLWQPRVGVQRALESRLRGEAAPLSSDAMACDVTAV